MYNLKILILGSHGFIGSHLFKYLENKYIISCAGAAQGNDELERMISDSDIIIHAIGVTRSQYEDDFFKINIDFSHRLYRFLCNHEKKKIIYLSSIHYHKNDVYGFTKRYNEYLFKKEEFLNKNQLFIIRTPGIFGPGAKPNNVSVISTFCYNKVNKIESIINDPDKELQILFIDDLILLIEYLFESNKNFDLIYPDTEKISVIELYKLIEKVGNNNTINLNEFSNSHFLKNITITYNSFKNASK